MNEGANVNTTTRGGYTALIHAIRRGHLDLAYFLMNAGANVNAATPGGPTAISFAVDRNRSAIAALLLIHGAEANDRETNYILEKLNEIGGGALATALSAFLPEGPITIALRQRIDFTPNEAQQAEIARVTGHIDRLANFLTRAGYNETQARTAATRAIAGVFFNLDETGVVALRSDEEAKDYYANVVLPKANELSLLRGLDNAFKERSLSISARANTIQYFFEASLIARVSLAITLLGYEGKEDESAIMTMLRAAKNHRLIRERIEESKAVEATSADDSKPSAQFPIAHNRELRAKAAEERRAAGLEDVKTSDQPARSVNHLEVKQVAPAKNPPKVKR